MSRRGTLVVSLCLLASLLAAGGPVFAATETGTINGTIKDENGGVLTGATVTIRGGSVMRVRTVATGEFGTFRLESLLPGKDYAMEIALEGFQTRKYEGIVVSVGRTATLLVTLEMEVVSSEITIADEASIVDITSPSASTNFSQDLLVNIPTASRQWTGTVNQAPGIADGSEPGYGTMWSARGGSVVNNQSAFDGVINTNPVYNTSDVGIVFETVEEVQVVNGALPAEYGNVSGAFVNVVTKSGGNQFRGEASFYHQDSSLESSNLDDGQISAGLEDPEISNFDDYSFTLGGPIVLERLWFNAALGVRNQSFVASGFPEDDTVDRGFGFAKLTWQPKANHSFVAMYNRQSTDTPYWPASEFYAPEATWVFDVTDEISKLKWIGVLSDNVFLEVDWGRNFNDSSFRPQPDAGDPYYELTTQYSSGGFATYQDNPAERNVYKAALSVFKDGVAGSHQLKFGVEYEDSAYDSWNYGISPIYTHYLFLGYPALVIMSNRGDGVANPMAMSGRDIYAQDTWAVSDRVTLSLGVRYNGWTGAYPAQSAEEFNYGPYVHFPASEILEDTDVIDWSSFEPRIGATIALDDRGKSALRIGLSRYHAGLNLSYFILANPNSLKLSINPWVDFDGDLFADPTEVFAPISSVAGTGLDPNLQQPYTDELTIGFEREIARDLSITVNATWREENRIIDDVNASVTEDSFVPIDVFDPGPDSIRGTEDDTTITMFNQVADFENSLVVSNPELAERDYKGIELILTKRLSNSWQALGSITWQDSNGTIGTDIFNARGWSGGFNDPNYLVNLGGPLSLDRTWQAKLMGTYLAPLGFVFSGYWQFQTGVPLIRSYSVNLFQGPTGVATEPWDSYREDDVSQLDLRAEKIFTFGARPVELGLILDLFNVFNSNAVTSSQSLTGTYDPATDIYVPSQGGFGRPLTVQDPRTLRLGARIRF